MENIVIRIDRELFAKTVSVDDFIALEEGKIKGIRNVVSWFISDGTGGYLPREKALAILGKLTIEQLVQLGKDFTAAAEGAAAGDPKASMESTEPTTPD